jgi:DNA-binding NarL/FixJ family response regulator
VTPANRPRVLIADDHRLVAEGIKSLLADDFELVGVVEDGRALVEAARKHQPDVIVADISMPHLGGIDAIEILKKDNAQVRVVFLTMHKEVVYARRALEAGASGYVIKHAVLDELIAAINAALQGLIYVTPALAGELLPGAGRRVQEAAAPAATLTERQRDILQLLVEGKSAKEIAAVLGISARTVESHKYQMMSALDLHSNAELVRFAIKHGIVDA